MALASSTVNDRRRIDPASAFRNSERYRIGMIQSASFAQAASASAKKLRSHVAVTDDICVDANHICAHVLQSTFAFPPIDLACSDRAAKKSSGPANAFFQLCRVKPDGSAGRAL
jgi:cephalosporin hydroxylase